MKTATAPVVRQHSTSIQVPEEHRGALISLLNARLSDSIDLGTQVKFAHWNVRGMNFYQLHLLFDQIAGHIIEQSDTIAERITALGGVARGTARQVATHSGLPEYNTEAVSGEQHLRTLIHNLSHHANTVRVAIDEADKLGDRDAADLFTQISRDLDKDLWFLEAHIEG